MTRKTWFQWEKAFLILTYPEYGYKPLVLASILNRSVASIKGQSALLGLKAHSLGGVKIGEKYNQLTVEKFLPHLSKKYAVCLFRCDCGKSKAIRASEVKNGGTKTCKRCKSSEFVSGEYFASIKWSASIRKIPFHIDIDYVNALLIRQDFKCAYTDLPISIQSFRKNRDHNTASLDRICNQKGYEKDNVHWVHKDVNKMKLHHSEEYFFQLCELITQKSKFHVLQSKNSS